MKKQYKKYILGGISLVICAALFALSVNLPTLIKNDYVNFANGDIAHHKPEILIDAGHGGVDGGAVSPIDKTVEKDLNLSIALKLRDVLQLMGFSVTMTRETDVSIHDDTAKTIHQKKVSDLKNRLNMLENGSFEMLVSIHMNIFGQSQYYGTQVFYGGNNACSKMLANDVQQSVKVNLQPENNRVVKESTKSIYLLYNAKKPAVMAECGFLSNSNELCKLKSAEYQQKMAVAIAAGIIKYRYTEI